MEDIEIIGLYFERNESALRETSEKYGVYCRSVAWNILKNNESAEECVNDTYMRAWESIPPAKPVSLGAYLARITRNLALNRINFSECEKRGGGSQALSFDELDEFLSGEYTVERTAEQNEIIGAINEFLRALPLKKQQLFIGRYWGMCSQAQLAKRFGMGENSVAKNLERTRKKLKDYLTKRGFEI